MAFAGFSIEPFDDIANGITVKRSILALRYVTEMRRGEHIVQRTEGMFRRQRFGVEYVYCVPGNLPTMKGIEQRRLIHDLSAGRIYQP